MKKYLFRLAGSPLIVGLILLSGCNSARLEGSRVHSPKRNVSSTSRTPQIDQTLEVMLKRIPGVEVIGSGLNAQVKIRNASSFLLTTEPLFVVNGVAVGHSFSSIVQNVSPADVGRIEVLKGADAAFYGARGANGVVLISLRGASE